MDLTREQALKLHREMWGDMQKELGDEPSELKRFHFKYDWLKKYGYVDKYGVPNIMDNCFLCEFALDKQYEDNFSHMRCNYCPIDWSELTDPSSDRHGFCIYINNTGYEVWQVAPISKILALPEREETK